MKPLLNQDIHRSQSLGTWVRRSVRGVEAECRGTVSLDIHKNAVE